jgi:hypothetical protein
LTWVGLRVSVAWIWVQEGGGVEDEVEGFQVFAGFLKKGVGWKMRWNVFKYLLGFSRRFLKRIYPFFSTEKL